jgi:hypothetical protein
MFDDAIEHIFENDFSGVPFFRASRGLPGLPGASRGLPGLPGASWGALQTL